jgi:hypothetical protein
MRKFKSPNQAQHFVNIHSAVNHSLSQTFYQENPYYLYDFEISRAYKAFAYVNALLPA